MTFSMVFIAVVAKQLHFFLLALQNRKLNFENLNINHFYKCQMFLEFSFTDTFEMLSFTQKRLSFTQHWSYLYEISKANTKLIFSFALLRCCCNVMAQRQSQSQASEQYLSYRLKNSKKKYQGCFSSIMNTPHIKIYCSRENTARIQKYVIKFEGYLLVAKYLVVLNLCISLTEQSISQAHYAREFL